MICHFWTPGKMGNDQRHERLPAFSKRCGTSTVTAFGKLIRTTAFRLTLVYLFLFALFAASLLGYFAWNTRRLINEQIMTSVNAQVGGVGNIYLRRGLLGLTRTIANRALRPGANLYLVTAPNGQAVGGNIESLAPGVMATTGWSETFYRRLEDQDTADPPPLGKGTEMRNGFRLPIRRDLQEPRRPVLPPSPARPRAVP